MRRRTWSASAIVPARHRGETKARVPFTLAEAVEEFVESPFVASAFGEKVRDHYAHFYRQEVAAYDAAVTDWERRRYFERI